MLELHYPTVTKTILERQYPGKPTLKVAFGNGTGAIFENSSKLRDSLFVTSRWPRSSGQTNYQVHHPNVITADRLYGQPCFPDRESFSCWFVFLTWEKPRYFQWKKEWKHRHTIYNGRGSRSTCRSRGRHCRRPGEPHQKRKRCSCWRNWYKMTCIYIKVVSALKSSWSLSSNN